MSQVPCQFIRVRRLIYKLVEETVQDRDVDGNPVLRTVQVRKLQERYPSINAAKRWSRLTQATLGGLGRGSVRVDVK